MKKISTADIAPGVGFPFAKKSLNFLQASYQEVIANLAQTMIGDVPSNTIGYVLYGCKKTLISGSDYSLTAGVVYFNGEIYSVPEVASIAIPTAPILTINEVYDTATDPTLFSDGTQKYPHKIRTMILGNGALGSGTLNFDDLHYCNRWRAFTPTFKGYDAAGIEVASSVSVNSPVAFYKYNLESIDVYISSVDLDIASAIRYIGIDLVGVSFTPHPGIISYLGVGPVLFMDKLVSGSGIPCVADIALLSDGRGSGLQVRKIDNTDFAATTNKTISLSIRIAIV